MREYKVKPIRALDRGLAVLDHLQQARAASLHDLHVATGLPKATLLRIVSTLAARGLLSQRLADGAYLASHTLQARPTTVVNDHILVELGSTVLERLCRKVKWPSAMSAPRLDHMAVIETNRPRSYLSHIPLGPIGFRINMLRSASGRAYLAFCGESERIAVLQRLRASTEPGNFIAKRPAMVERLLEETRRLGYGHRTPDFGGHFDKPRREWDDERDSIAVPVWAGAEVVAAINLTWMHRVATVDQMVKAHLVQLRDASHEISAHLAGVV
jgi:IclR family mhp operon transcriptional activator